MKNKLVFKPGAQLTSLLLLSLWLLIIFSPALAEASRLPGFARVNDPATAPEASGLYPESACLSYAGQENQEVKNQEVKQTEKKEQTEEKTKTETQAQTNQENQALKEQTKKEEPEKAGQENKAEAKEKKKTIKEFLLPWKKTIELSYVVTGGNTISSSFSLGNTLILTPNVKDTYTVKTYFLRAHSTSITKKAVGTPDNFTIEEEKTRRLTAENYLISGQYDHKVTGRLVTNAAFVWDRNKFSGVEGRALWTAGAGLNLANNERQKINTSAGVSFTIRKYTGQDLNSFRGFRYTFTWDQKLFDNAFFGTGFIFDDNLAHPSDWRYDWTNNLTAPLSKSLALKTSLKITRTHRPPDLKVPLLNYDYTETGQLVSIPRQKVDTFFTTTIVLSF
jgi:putative salt-induced outer membrane protein YdiY